MFRLKNLLLFLLVLGLFMQTALTKPHSPNSTDVAINDDNLDSLKDSPAEGSQAQPTADHDLPAVSDNAVPGEDVPEGNDQSEVLGLGGGKSPASRPNTWRTCLGVCDWNKWCHCAKTRCRCWHRHAPCKCINHFKSRDESAEDDGQSDVAGLDAVDGLNATDGLNTTDDSDPTDGLDTPVDLNTTDDSGPIGDLDPTDDLNTTDDTNTTDDLETPVDLNATDDSITTSGLNLTEGPNNQTLIIIPPFPPVQCKGICNLKHKCYCSNSAVTHCRCPRIGVPCSCTRYLDSPAARLESADSNTTPTLDTRSASETDEEGLDTNGQLDTNEEVESTPVSHLAQAPAGPCKGRCTIHGKCMCGGLTKCTCRHAGKTCSCVN